MHLTIDTDDLDELSLGAVQQKLSRGAGANYDLGSNAGGSYTSNASAIRSKACANYGKLEKTTNIGPIAYEKFARPKETPVDLAGRPTVAAAAQVRANTVLDSKFLKSGGAAAAVAPAAVAEEAVAEEATIEVESATTSAHVEAEAPTAEAGAPVAVEEEASPAEAPPSEAEPELFAGEEADETPPAAVGDALLVEESVEKADENADEKADEQTPLPAPADAAPAMEAPAVEAPAVESADAEAAPAEEAAPLDETPSAPADVSPESEPSAAEEEPVEETSENVPNVNALEDEAAMEAAAKAKAAKKKAKKKARKAAEAAAALGAPPPMAASPVVESN